MGTVRGKAREVVETVLWSVAKKRSANQGNHGITERSLVWLLLIIRIAHEQRDHPRTEDLSNKSNPQELMDYKKEMMMMNWGNDSSYCQKDFSHDTVII